MRDQIITDYDLDFLEEEGERIYHERLKFVLEPQYKGRIIAIEVENGDYSMADTVGDALRNAKAKYPDKIFYVKRVGYRAVRKKR